MTNSIKLIYKIVSSFLTFVNFAEEFTVFRIPDHILFLDTFDFIRQKNSGKVGILISKHKIFSIFKDVNDIHGFEKLVTRQVFSENFSRICLRFSYWLLNALPNLNLQVKTASLKWVSGFDSTENFCKTTAVEFSNS